MVKKFTPSLVTSYFNYGYQPTVEAEMVQAQNGEWVKLQTFTDTNKMNLAMIERLKAKLSAKKSAEEMWDEFIGLLEEKNPLGKDDDNVRHHVNFLGSITKYKKIFMEANRDE